MADAGKIVITPKGAYSSTKTYEWLDEVSYNGNAYVALKTVTGVTPSDDGVNWRLFMSSADVDANVLVPKFTEASTRSNIVSGENLSTMFGKIKKWFTDLKSHAFKDLVNNLTTSTTGSALDASQGKILKDEVDGVNRNLDLLECNIVDLVEYYKDYSIDADSGDLVNFTGFTTSGFIRVLPNTTYTLTYNLANASDYPRFAFYDSDKSYIKRVNGTNATSQTFTTTSETQYIRFFVYSVSYNSASIIAIGDLGEQIINTNESLNAQGLLNLADVVTLSTDKVDVRTGYIPCKVGDVVYSTYTDAVYRYNLYFVNSAKEIVQRVFGSNVNEMRATAPSGTVYIMAAVNTDNTKTLSSTDLKVYINNEIDNLKNDLSTHTHNYAGSDTPGGSATYALQANKDGAGNVIDATYINKTYMRNYGAGSIAFGNNMFIGIFNGDIICSSDGQEWEVNFEPNLFSLLDNDEILLGITYGNEKFVSFSNKGCSYVSSDNGNTWTKTQTIITV